MKGHLFSFEGNMILSRDIEKTLAAWAKRHSLPISDVYQDKYYYFDVVDDLGGKYEISIFNDTESESIEVGVWNHQKKSRGFRVKDLSGLERVLDRAYAQILKWIERSKVSREKSK